MLIGCPLGPRTQPCRSALRSSFTIMNFMNFHSVFYLVFHLVFYLAAQLNVALEALIIDDDVERVNVDYYYYYYYLLFFKFESIWSLRLWYSTCHVTGFN